MKTVRATEYIQMMFQGRSRSQLVLASDNNRYVVKLIGNPQGSRILANECVTGELADALGAPCLPRAIVEVDDAVISQINQRMNHVIPNNKTVFRPGPQFGTLYLGPGWPYPNTGRVRILPSTLKLMAAADNSSTWPSAIVLNALVQNEDSRYTHILVMVDTVTNESRYWLIDHGHCLAVERGWQTLQVEGVALKEPLYPELVKGHEPFREQLERLEAITPGYMGELLDGCPLRDWEVSREDQDALVRYIMAAKATVADRIRESRSRFPSWN